MGYELVYYGALLAPFRRTAPRIIRIYTILILSKCRSGRDYICAGKINLDDEAIRDLRIQFT
jgi:hypothetical protein